ncbi:hypothetical protein C7H19_14460 [Aphanothece hegewaldii CCALA 016]|uniref:Uncharacterized protein n=1 Tax=Aphanothece hegewaldii CCALA 016 TaxID=2107694 RepID=A0A2T1LWB4_9CHRO|nr:hypothetical protein C7H19_14460 [Aphanothece hegewaldii CCALA 016]
MRDVRPRQHQKRCFIFFKFFKNHYILIYKFIFLNIQIELAQITTKKSVKMRLHEKALLGLNRISENTLIMFFK